MFGGFFTFKNNTLKKSPLQSFRWTLQHCSSRNVLRPTKLPPDFTSAWRWADNNFEYDTERILSSFNRSWDNLVKTFTWQLQFFLAVSSLLLFCTAISAQTIRPECQKVSSVQLHWRSFPRSALSSLYRISWLPLPPFSSGILIKGNTKCSGLDEPQFRRGLQQTKARWFTVGRPPPLFCQRTEETAGGWISAALCL